jgi:diketogulonate reductase-like aldo/keto reductase
MGSNALAETVTLNNGVKIPRLGLGVWQSGGATKSAVLSALNLGYRHIDTAAVYGNEALVGAAVAEAGLPREELFVTTKLWNSDHGYDKALRAFETSLRRLRLEYVDLYLMHWPVEGLRLESWRALETIANEGRARAIGVSNFMVHHLNELASSAKVLPAVNQIELTPFLQRADTVAKCRDLGIVLEAYSPLTHGQRLGDPVLVDVARELHRTPAQVLLRWGLQRNFVILPKSVKPERIAENAAVFDFVLSGEQLQRMDALEEGLVTGWDPATQA